MVGYQNMSKPERAEYMREYRKQNPQPKKRRPLDRSRPVPTRRKGRDLVARRAYLDEWREVDLAKPIAEPKEITAEIKQDRKLRRRAYMCQYMRWYRDQQRCKSATADTQMSAP